MSKYKVIKSIIESTRIKDDDKVYFIEWFVKGWYTEEDVKWIWE